MPSDFLLEFMYWKFDGKWKYSFIFHFFKKKKKLPQKIYIFMIIKDWNFCFVIKFWILQAVAVLDKKLKIFILIFSTLILHIFKILFFITFLLVVAF